MDWIDWRFPWMLSLLAVVPAAAAFFVFAQRRRRAALERFAEAHLLDTLAPEHTSGRHAVRAAMLLAALTLVVLALGGPRWGFHWEEVRREGVDVVVALDTSRSMLAEDVKPNRIERAKLAVQDLVRQLRGDRVGLVAFAGSAFVQCPLTLDYDAFNESLRAVDVGIIPKGGTAIAEAITASLSALEGHQSKHEAIIVITDGEDHEGKVDEAAKAAADKGVKIYTVGIGAAEGELIPLTVDGRSTFLKDRKGQVVKSRLDSETLEKVATTTGGAYVHGTGPSLGLDEVYTGYIGKMEKRELESAMEKRFEERFQLPLLLAFALFAIEPLVAQRRGDRRRTWRLPFLRRTPNTTSTQ